MVTLGVADIGRARDFYAALGWQGQTVQETVFFQAGGIAVVLWGREDLAADAGVPLVAGSTVALAHNVRSRQEVDGVVAAVLEAGGTVTRPPRETFYGGYAAYVADPDGHLWEVAHNPGFPLAGDGSITVPDLRAQQAQE